MYYQYSEISIAQRKEFKEKKGKARTVEAFTQKMSYLYVPGTSEKKFS
jgi:hypothetical protein